MDTDPSGAREIGRFRSKRNRVTLIDMEWDGFIIPVVMKEYPAAEAAERECCLLRRLDSLNINVPCVYKAQGNVLYLQYIKGILLTEIIDNVSAYPTAWIDGLAGWYYSLHRATIKENGAVMLKDDANLRNFIFLDNSFYAIDFEDEIYGRPEQDIAECCAYILSNDPSFTGGKFQVVNKFIDAYCRQDRAAHKEVVREDIKRSLKNIAGYRKQQSGDIINSLPLVDFFVS